MVAQRIEPQEGPQAMFLSSTCDIAVYGGAAGGGKTYAALLEPLRHIHNPDFRAVFFRRTSKQITAGGGLWDESHKIYPGLGGEPRVSELTWVFPSGAKISFNHLQHMKNSQDHQGAQYPLIIWDELVHFEEEQFFYLMSRNRAGSCEGVKPYIRATCNPDADSWVKRFIAPWVDAKYEGKKAESGEVRWFYRMGGEICHIDTIEERDRIIALGLFPKTLTFIAATLADNKILTDRDPSYRASLLALPSLERKRLLEGDWGASAATKFFLSEWIEKVPVRDLPFFSKIVRYWDLAGTRLEDNRKACKTAGVKVGITEEGEFYILDVKTMRGRPDEVKKFVRAVAEMDGREVYVAIEQEPGSAAIAVMDDYQRALAGYKVKRDRVAANKAKRHEIIQTTASERNLKWVLNASWNHSLAAVLDDYPSLGVDEVDALAGAIDIVSRSGGFAFI